LVIASRFRHVRKPVTALYDANERLRDALAKLPAPPTRQRR
jgi:hypothetical protein